MGKEIEAPVKVKIKSQLGGFDVVIKARVSSDKAVSFAEMLIEELQARGFKTFEGTPPTAEVKETNKETGAAVLICPIHGKELVKRKGQYGDFWACPSKDENGEWCKWRPEKKKQK